MSEIKLW